MNLLPLTLVLSCLGWHRSSGATFWGVDGDPKYEIVALLDIRMTKYAPQAPPRILQIWRFVMLGVGTKVYCGWPYGMRERRENTHLHLLVTPGDEALLLAYLMMVGRAEIKERFGLNIAGRGETPGSGSSSSSEAADTPAPAGKTKGRKKGNRSMEPSSRETRGLFMEVYERVVAARNTPYADSWHRDLFFHEHANALEEKGVSTTKKRKPSKMSGGLGESRKMPIDALPPPAHRGVFGGFDFAGEGDGEVGEGDGGDKAYLESLKQAQQMLDQVAAQGAGAKVEPSNPPVGVAMSTPHAV